MTASETTAPSADEELRRIIPIAAAIGVFLLFINAFVCATWACFTGTQHWLIWQFIPGTLPVAFIATTIMGFRFSNPLLRAIYTIAAIWVGILNYFFFATVACWLVYGISRLIEWPLSPIHLAEGLFGIALYVSAYGLVNAAWIRTTKIKIRLPNLPESWNGRTAALVTDLHLGHISRTGFLRRVLARLRSLQPDIVFISGDLFDGTPVELNSLADGWRHFSAPRGVFYVTGNHDEFAERSLYTSAVERTGVHVLHNEMVTVEGLQIIGAHDSEAGNADELRKIFRQVKLDTTKPSVLLAHRPENLAVANEEGVSLQLSGHTHGGQILPWTLLVDRIYGKFAHGLNRLGQLQVYTSYGVGTWGPPLRVGTYSELVLIQFVK